jgi:hypothetical protein
MDQVKKSAYQTTQILNDIDSLYTAVNGVAEFQIKFDEENFKILKTGLSKNTNKTIETADKFMTVENSRSLYTILLFVFYIIIFALSIAAFFKRWPNLILALSIVLLLTLPLILLYTGLLTSYFYLYSDCCGDVYSAIYENEMPIHGKGLGYITSCFDMVIYFNLENQICNFCLQLRV